MKRYAGPTLLTLWMLTFSVAATAASAASCPNEALRTGPSAGLGECRAYEMVSPVDKNGANVNQKTNVRTSPSGDAVSFFSTASFSGDPASPLGNAYVSRRGAESWGTESVDAPQVNPRGFLLITSPASSDDFGKTLQISKVALTPGAVEGGSNVYIRDNLSGERTLVAAKEGNALFQNLVGGGAGAYLDGSPDWSHMLMRSGVALTAEAPEGANNLYDFSGGQLHLVNVLPDGSVNPSGAHAGGTTMPYAHTVSEDGSRIFFTDGEFGAGGIYVREDDATTTAISASQRSGELGEVKQAEFGAASVDGSLVYFISQSNLTEASEGGLDLYRYELDSGTLTDLTPQGGPLGPQVRQVLATSADGSYVYFAAAAALAEGATEAGFANTNVYVWHEGQIKYIGQTAEDEPEFNGFEQRLASVDGTHFAFASFSPMTAADVPSPACPTDPVFGNAAEACRDVYSYDYASGQLTCVSCDGPGRGDSGLGGLENREVGLGDDYAHAVLDDGTVFFDTPNRLLSRDANGVGDVYAWREGELQLISTGMSKQSSNFGDASLDGRNVFIRTNQPLVKQDIDGSVDVYDVRVDGGLAAQNPPGAPAPCEGEACRSESPAPPGAQPPASAGPGGGGNLPPRCARLSRAAERAAGKADKLDRAAKRARGKRAGKLRHQAHSQERKAHRLNAKARNCGGRV